MGVCLLLETVGSDFFFVCLFLQIKSQYTALACILVPCPGTHCVDSNSRDLPTSVPCVLRLKTCTSMTRH